LSYRPGAQPSNTTGRSRSMICSSLASRCPSLEVEGAGNAGCALHPRSHVPKCARMAAHEHTGQRRTLRHPLRNGFTAYNVLSPVSGLVVTVTRGCSTGLAPASRRQDHTTSPYADSVSSGARRCLTPPASTASHPNVWWRWPTPLLGDRMARFIILICRNVKRNIFGFRA
jgi:hypothetical protein